MTTGPGGASVPWLDESKREYGELAAKTIGYTERPPEDPNELVFTGPCPRCGDQFTYSWPLEVVRGVRVMDVTVFCRCRGTHAGRPEGEWGCGAYWSVVVDEPRHD